MAIAKLSIDLEARLAGLQAGLDKAGLLAQRSADKIEQSFAGVGSVIKGIGAGLVGSLSVGALVAIFKTTNDGLLKIKDLSEATGASIEKISGLEDVARRAGGSIDDVSGILVKFNAALKDSSKTKELGAALDAIGLSAEELKKLDPAEALLQTAIALDKFADDGNKARLTQELFGKSIKDAGPYLRELAEAGALNGKVTKEQVLEADKFNKELAKLSTFAQDAARSLTGPLVSSINETIGKFREGAKEGKSFYRVIYEEQLKVLGLLKEPPPKLDSKAGAGRGFVNPELIKPSLPGALGGDADADAAAKKVAAAAKKAADERVKLSEFAARQIVDIEEQAAKDTADAWKFWERIQIDNSKAKVDAEKLQWQQVFDFIDAQQQREIDEGQAYMDAMADDAKKVTEDLNQQLGLVFSSAAGDAIAHWEGVRAVLKGVLADLAQIVLKKTLTDPLGKAIGDSLPKFDFGSFDFAGLLKNFVPKFATGTPYVPHDMLAMVHKGERITPASQNRGGMGGGTFIFNIAPGADADSFRRSQRQIEADLTRTMRRAGGIA